MDVCFASQSFSPPEASEDARGAGETSRAPARPRTSAGWVAAFRENAARPRPVPWACGAGVTPAELAAIARSLQAWQLGETSEGRHLRAAAARYAARAGD